MHQLHRFRRCLLYDNRNPINNWVWSAEAHYQHYAATHFQSVLTFNIYCYFACCFEFRNGVKWLVRFISDM